MGEFTVRNVRLEVPERLLDARLREGLAAGRYEQAEAAALDDFLRPTDRVLELGGGLGYLAVRAARIVGPGAVTVVEANPDLLPIIRANLLRNGAEGVRLIHGAAVADEMADTEQELHVSGGFWGGSLAPPDRRARRHKVPGRGLHALIRAAGATALIIDVEGAEEVLLARPLPHGLRLVVLEVHPTRYPESTIAEMAATLAAAGLERRVRPWGRDVWVLERPDRAAAETSARRTG